MSEAQINKLAKAFADATGITVDEAKIALEDQDSAMVRMAQGIVRLHRHETIGVPIWLVDVERS